MSIDFNDIISAAQSQIQVASGRAEKTRLLEAHKEELAQIGARHQTEKADNASAVETAQAAFDAAFARLHEASGLARKQLEDMIGRQASVLIDAQIFAAPAGITLVKPAAVASGSTAPASSTGPADGAAAPKRRGRRTNAEIAAANAAAAAAAGTTATADPNQGEQSADSDDGSTTLQEDLTPAANGAPEMADDTAGSDFDAPEDLTETTVEATIVESLVVTPADTDNDFESIVEEAVTASVNEPSTNSDGFDAPLETVPATATEAAPVSGEEEIADDFAIPAEPIVDEFAELAAASQAQTDEEFEVPSFLRRAG